MRELGGQYSVAKDKRPQTFKEKDELSKMRTKERQLLRLPIFCVCKCR